MDSIQIPKHYADAFKSNVFHKAQQATSVLAGKVRMESHDYGAESIFYDSYEATATNKRTERAQKTKIVSTDRDRRSVQADFYDWADLIDKIDKVKMVHDPESPLTKAATMAFMRRKDQVIYEAGLGTAFTGQKGIVPVVLPTTQKIVAFDGTTTGDIGNLNIRTLAKIKRKFFDANVGTGSDLAVDGAMFNIALRGAQIEQMLNDPTITSMDYAAVKALVMGDIDTFMGFKFHIYNGLAQDNAQITYSNATGAIGSGTNTGTAIYDRCLVWYNDGILLSQGQDMRVEIDKRPDLSNVTQIYADMHLGAVRMEEVKVIELIAKAA